MATWLTIRENTAFRTLYYRGKSQVCPALVTYVRKNRLGVPRVGITTGKKLGKAVQRRMRRTAKKLPIHAPWRVSASTAYAEQVGEKRQVGGV